jgi:EpsI family protein
MEAASRVDLGQGAPGFAPSRREVLLGGAFGAAAILSGLARPGTDRWLSSRSLEAVVPASIGPWRQSSSAGVLIPQGEDDPEAVYDDLLTRNYVSDAASSVMLLVAYGNAQTGGTQLHRPEVCYPAAGFRMQRSSDTRLRLAGDAVVRARLMTAVARGRVEQILYWTRIGRDFPTDSLGQRWSVLRQTLQGNVPDGALVRMSTINPDQDAGDRVLRNFASALAEPGGPELRRLLLGV